MEDFSTWVSLYAHICSCMLCVTSRYHSIPFLSLSWKAYLKKSKSYTNSLVTQRLKHLPARRETRVQSLGREDPLEKEMATHFSILAWKIPWTEEPGRLQSTGSQRVRHDWATSLTHSLINLSELFTNFIINNLFVTCHKINPQRTLPRY